MNAGQQTGIVSIAQLQPISVIFTEPQEYVDRINQALAAGSPEVTVTNADGAKLATGKLTISDNQVDVATGTIRLKAEFENKDNALWPGLAVTTGLQLGVDKDVLIVPAGSGPARTERALRLCRRRSESRRRPAGEGRASESRRRPSISEGLKEGERVVTAGEFLLQPGAQVAIDAGSGS